MRKIKIIEPKESSKEVLEIERNKLIKFNDFIYKDELEQSSCGIIFGRTSGCLADYSLLLRYNKCLFEVVEDDEGCQVLIAYKK